MRKKEIQKQLDSLYGYCDSLRSEVEALKKCHRIDANDCTYVGRYGCSVKRPAYIHEEQSGHTKKAGIVSFTELARLVIDGKMIDCPYIENKKIGIHTEEDDK